MASRRKKAKTGAMTGVSGTANFRWTPDDIKNDLPARFERICERNGLTFSGATRALICHFVEIVEAGGGTITDIKKAAEYSAFMAELPRILKAAEAPGKYGAKKGKKR